MKKKYITPDINPKGLMSEELMLQASNTQAAADADALSRGNNGQNGGSFWDDSE